jgi:nicotinamidase-related amidase
MVVDVQNGFVNEQSAHVVPVIDDLAARWLAARGRVIFTRYRNEPGSLYERLIGWYELQSPDQIALSPQLEHHLDDAGAEVIDKTVYSALTGQGLAAVEAAGFTEVVVCGIATDACVLATVLSAFDRGLTPWVVTDACASNASRHEAAEVHRIALILMGRLIGEGQLITVREALMLLPSEAPAR